ncbi:ABC transporter substrate-binding protein [Streptomyces sp. NBC_00335]|uniref:bifunctional serine/threonine-protein kinase/ABC transporter substrate-binding protein n=1 Tax=unclassified Streptomyces TaxID=2593676 RepID=UPI00224D7937|nr:MULTISPECIES: bifunctional serine/threonine-protein kinase/ABC transporter substrate-binding protein [unclassified Streptomyces]MCX5402422.1 ABC transporter substrate-binding protein [Streptomyces sp. NBC_00086]
MTEQKSELIAGRYQLVEAIGQGGMGRVWRGLDQQLFGREVAIKEILFPVGLGDGERATLLRRFTGEARAAVTLSHPGIITIHDVVEHHGAPVIVMEFIRGRSLAAAIREQGRLPVRRVAEIGAAMLGALTEAHGARIIHRDIKPDNVLLTKDRVVLTDFGIAHLADATTKLSQSGTVIGTPHYMPPEQLEGKRPTPANDLWALGATLYHAVEGRPPFEADGLHALAVAVFTRPHRPPAHAGPLAPLLDALLTKDPAQRIGAAEAAELLASALQSSPSREGTTDEADSGRPESAPVPDAATEHAPTPTKRETELPSSAPLPTPTAVEPAHVPDTSRPPVPERPTTPPVAVPSAEDVISLGWTDRQGREEGASTRRRALTRRSAVLGMAMVTLAAGSVLTWKLTRGNPPGGGTTGGGSTASPITVVIGVDAPLSGGGDLSAMGVGMKNSADLAVRTSNRTGHVPGVNFEIKALDDEATPAKGGPNATQFVDDEKVLGVVGPLTSGVAKTMAQPLGQANLVNVSPSNTDPVLTLGPDWAKGSKSRPYKTYFRTVATDVDQGPFAARYLHGEAGKRKLYVIGDGSAYGTGLASGFGSAFAKLGGTVVGTDQIDPAQDDFSYLAPQIRASGADAVYFGGYYDAAGPLSQQLKQAGVSVPLMGGDGMFDQQFLTTNTKAEGDLATGLGVPTEGLAKGQDFLDRYQEAGYSEAAGSYGPSAYDATWAVIEAVKALVEDNGGALPAGARAKMSQAVSGLAFDGVTGRVAFDEYGDTVNRQLTVYSVKGGSWTTVKSGPAAD